MYVYIYISLSLSLSLSLSHTHTHTHTHTHCYLAGGNVEGVGEFADLVILCLNSEVLERASEREVFAQRVPPQMALLYELLQLYVHM